MEKPLFLREVLNRTYSVSAYFWGKSASDMPFHLLYPILSVVITYFIVGLNTEPISRFFVLSKIFLINYLLSNFLIVGIGEVCFFTGVSYGLLLSVLFPKAEMAMSLVPMLIVPFMLFAGFFVNQNNIPYYFYPILYLSMFKYGFQSAVQVVLFEFSKLKQ